MTDNTLDKTCRYESERVPERYPSMLAVRTSAILTWKAGFVDAQGPGEVHPGVSVRLLGDESRRDDDLACLTPVERCDDVRRVVKSHGVGHHCLQENVP